MSAKRYPEEFKIEAIKQVTERGHTVADVASQPAGRAHPQPVVPSRRVAHSQVRTQAREILKRAAAHFAKQSG